MIRTLLADRDSIARTGIRAVLGKRRISLDVDEACNSAELLMRLHTRYYELIVIDPDLLGGAPDDCVRLVRQSAPWSALLVFTSFDELTHGKEAIRRGAKGYLMKHCSSDELVAAVARVAAGRIYCSRALGAEFAAGFRQYDSRLKPHEALGRREFEVFAMAVCGLTVVEMASVLRIGVEAVKELKEGAASRLQLASAGAMIGYAKDQDLLEECRATSSSLWSRRYGMALPAA